MRVLDRKGLDALIGEKMRVKDFSVSNKRGRALTGKLGKGRFGYCLMLLCRCRYSGKRRFYLEEGDELVHSAGTFEIGGDYF